MTSTVDLGAAYAEVESPFGPLLAVVTERGLARLAYPDEPERDVLDPIAAEGAGGPEEDPARLDDVRRQLTEYFEGGRRRFELPIDWSLTHGFGRRVLQATARIPYGSVSTYGDVARRAGSPRAFRAAGNALAGNPIPIVVPCHRVVHAGGGLGGYTGGLHRKEHLLRLEGALEA